MSYFFTNFATVLIIKTIIPMNKAELIVELAEKSRFKNKKAKKVLEAYMEIVTEKCPRTKKYLSLVLVHYYPDRKTAVWLVILKQVLRYRSRQEQQ